MFDSAAKADEDQRDVAAETRREATMDAEQKMRGKVCLVTGANNGIGKETAASLATMGATVVMTSRDRAKGEMALANIRSRPGSESIELMLVDFASFSSIRQFAATMTARHPRLDVLLNNAGAINSERLLTADGHEMTFGVNHLGYFLLTSLLLDALKAAAPSRIINVSSRAHVRATIDFADLESERSYSGFRAYGQSKLANVLFTFELARRLEGTGVTANCLHPGVVGTGFGRNNRGLIGALFDIYHVVGAPFILSAARGAETSIYLASSPDVENVNGKYFARCRITPSSAISCDESIARRLWDVSEEMIAAGAATST